MTNFMEYVKASYELIMRAQEQACLELDYEVGAFVVHTFAKYMDHPIDTQEPVAIKLLTAVNSTGEARKQKLLEISEQCVLIDGLEINRNRWVSSDYYKNIGVIALEHRAYSERPPELLYERVARDFSSISKVLHFIKE